MPLHQAEVMPILGETLDLSESPTAYLERTTGLDHDSGKFDPSNELDRLSRDCESPLIKRKS